MVSDAPLSRLDESSLLAAVRDLAARDPDLARVVAQHGPPPLWSRPAGFATLVFIILEQQVSLASARAAFTRLEGAAVPLTPRRFLELSGDELKGIGFSRQKAFYARALAEAILSGRFDPRELEDLPDPIVRERMVSLKGIGDWSADIYLMEALLRPDVWPCKDLALASAVREVKRLRTRPSPERLARLGRKWRPLRSVAARIFWHHYLSARGNGRPAASPAPP